VERDLFAWILIGLVTGAVGKFSLLARTPGGYVAALLLGIAGALAGGFLALQLSGGAPSVDASLLAAAAGAVLALALYGVVMRVRLR
jgi:uncharacterized membrane protein YeaQ/YmgE (transglycosylase-associated protein family)